MPKETGEFKRLLSCYVENFTTKNDDYVELRIQYSIKQFINLTTKKPDIKSLGKEKGLLFQKALTMKRFSNY